LIENIKQNKVGKFLEEAPYIKLSEDVVGYHSMTQDMILNEVFRRVEPNGRTMSEFFEEEIRQQYEIEGVHMVVQDKDEHLVYDYRNVGMSEQFKSHKNQDNDDKISPFGGWMQLMGMMGDYKRTEKAGLSLMDRKKYKYPDEGFSGAVNENNLNPPITRKMECTSVFVFASARCLAKMMAYVANKGTLNGK